MNIQKNISLKPYNTFGIDVNAKYFVEVSSREILKEALECKQYNDKFILGGGSNMLLTQDISGLVMHINNKGIEIVSETETQVMVKAQAGEVWHDFVVWCIQNDFGGIENLSLIPGNVGTSPIQNIGAYGVEIKDVFVECEAINIYTLESRVFKKKECQFDYRNSIFKNKVKHQYIILSVTLKLTKKNHEINISYGAISEELNKLNIDKPTIADVSNAVVKIRQSKLPDPNEIGNSGSFFKNPVIDHEHFNELKHNFPDIPSYKISDSQVKVPAGWLIEKAGFKGKRFGDYGVHKKQALVLVNYGNAKGSDILKLAELIKKTIKRLFNISLETEVNII